MFTPSRSLPDGCHRRVILPAFADSLGRVGRAVVVPRGVMPRRFSLPRSASFAHAAVAARAAHGLGRAGLLIGVDQRDRDVIGDER